jgi:hypothetical protein
MIIVRDYHVHFNSHTLDGCMIIKILIYILAHGKNKVEIFYYSSLMKRLFVFHCWATIVDDVTLRINELQSCDADNGWVSSLKYQKAISFHSTFFISILKQLFLIFILYYYKTKLYMRYEKWYIYKTCTYFIF